ncbi:hypothetical protein BDV93DRAFT_434600 [Ceratobasidium sp. AG-I]|nr:hypothetical protein BDV93DRAFT_434600 [Ceratobasidium sp. AG-I]
MSDEEDDYLSDKFLASLEAPKPSTSGAASYAERRRVAQRESERKRMEGRIKSRRELEEESRREGLSRSLFEKEMEKAAENKLGEGSKSLDGELKVEGGGSGASKAMSMMLKMGFKPGETLGKKEEPVKSQEATPTPDDAQGEEVAQGKKAKSGHLTEPLPLAMWAGKKGLGLGKRTMSPPLSGSSKVTKRTAEEDAAERSRNELYRTQARGEYEEKRDEGRLRAALRTRATLDDANGIQFNVLQLNPTDPSSVPLALYDLLTRTSLDAFEDPALVSKPGYPDRAIAARLKEQMKADSLRPLDEALEEDERLAGLQPETSTKSTVVAGNQPDFDEETVEAAREYLQKSVPERLDTLLEYLRSKYFYCFWCGANYNDLPDLEANCPGTEEDDH